METLIETHTRKGKRLFKWDEVKVQFKEEQQKEIEHIIWMAKSTGDPQKAILGNTGISFAVFSTGLLYKIEEDIEEGVRI